MKKLTFKLKKSLGKNNQGRITVWHRGGGVSKRYRVIDFNRLFLNLNYLIIKIEYDPYRTAYIGLIIYSNGILSYILLCKNMKLFGKYTNAIKGPLLEGNSYFIKNLPLGSIICNLELFPGKGSILMRSAGCYGQILSKYKDINLVLVRLRSGEEYLLNGNNMASLGIVSNLNNKYKKKKKAGISRHLNKRPHVRGVAMNPIDHPHGGGEGKTSGGRPSVDSWGNLTKGKPTRLKSKKNKFIIKRSKKK